MGTILSIEAKKIEETSGPSNDAPIVPNYSASYKRVVQRLMKLHPLDEAMSLSRGGEMHFYAALENLILQRAGLKEGHMLIDVGCGPGGLSGVVSASRYLGTDIVQEIIDYARERCKRPNYEFTLVDEIQIPAPDQCADFVCFFSVFTHILHEDIYRYLRECMRVLKSGGKVVFSFLEFQIPCHWPIFENMIKGRDRKWSREHTQFISRDFIEVCARHLGFEVEDVFDGDKPQLIIEKPLTRKDGTVMQGPTEIGQSVCVLRKP